MRDTACGRDDCAAVIGRRIGVGVAEATKSASVLSVGTPDICRANHNQMAGTGVVAETRSAPSGDRCIDTQRLGAWKSHSFSEAPKACSRGAGITATELDIEMKPVGEMRTDRRRPVPGGHSVHLANASPELKRKWAAPRAELLLSRASLLGLYYRMQVASAPATLQPP
jgi:hypothetical protein